MGNKKSKSSPPNPAKQQIIQNPENNDEISNKSVSRMRADKKKKVPDEFSQTLVIDNGSYLIRAGFCGDSSPRSVFPPIVGRLTKTGSVYVGDEALSKTGTGILTNYAITHGVIENWDDMVQIWHHTFYNELRITPEDHPLLLTESAFNPRQNREKTVEIIFEKFNIPALYLANTSLCAMIASGRSSAVVLDAGYECTEIVPIYDGVVTNAITKIDIGGRHITEYLMKLLCENGYNFTTFAEKQSVETMKHDLGFIALDYVKELHRTETSDKSAKRYELPDGKIISFEGINIERFKCAECLFDPLLIGDHSVGICKLLEKGIRTNGKYIMDMCGNIVVCGVNSKLGGFEDRIQKDLSELMNKNDVVLMGGYVRLNSVQEISMDIVELICKYNPQLKVKFIMPPERSFSVWIGGSVLVTALSNDSYISKSDYEEYGVRILDKKCM